MCGRLNLSDLDGIRNLMAQIGMPLFAADQPVRFNVSPGTHIPVLHRLSAEHKPVTSAIGWSNMHWGMPVNTRPGAPMAINARCETAHEKPLFKHLTQSQRAIVPANGFYEWLKQGRERRAFHFTASDNSALLMAGLWRRSQSGHRETVILTAAANVDMADIHDRMPVMLNADQAHRWLSGETELSAAVNQWHPGQLVRRAVATHVNDARHDASDCLDDAQAEPYTKDLFS